MAEPESVQNAELPDNIAVEPEVESVVPLTISVHSLSKRLSMPDVESAENRKVRSESHILIPQELTQAVNYEDDDLEDKEDKTGKIRGSKEAVIPTLKTPTEVFDVTVGEEDYYVPPVEEVEEEEEEVEEEESESTISEESEELLDRDEYIQLYKELVKQFMPIKAKNVFLQRKMAEYFKRRKMEHVLRETDQIEDSLAKYKKKLDLLFGLRQSDTVQRDKINTDVSALREQRKKQYEQVTTLFKAIQKREREVGTGLIYTKTGREIPEKFLDRLFTHQSKKTEEITNMRLKCIRLRDAVLEKQQQIRDMDKIGEHHTLIDFEQLKMENQAHADKIEERDEELARLRVTFSNAIECLAHIREKCVSNSQTIQERKIFLNSVSEQLLGVREKVNKIKLQRDNLRSESRKLKQESGLLTKPKLLKDMEDAITQYDDYLKHIDEIKTKYEEGKKRLHALKKNVTIAKKQEIPIKKAQEKSEEVKLYKGRPSLMIPILEAEQPGAVNYINI